DRATTERRMVAGATTRRVIWPKGGHMSLPLPEGEGWGEGEGRALPSSACDLLWSQTTQRLGRLWMVGRGIFEGEEGHPLPRFACGSRNNGHGIDCVWIAGNRRT